jgi:hypothetical protein
MSDTPTENDLRAIRKAAKRARKKKLAEFGLYTENPVYKDKTLKVAFCFSGQLRTWRKCIPTWKKLFKDLKDNYNVSNIDVFCHIWDHNTLQHGIAMTQFKDGVLIDPIDNSVVLPDSEINEYINLLNPVSYKIDNIEVSKSIKQQTSNKGLIESQYSGKFVNSWMAPQLYSIMYAAHLKKMHEIKNEINYDLCIRMRNDLYLNEDFRADFSIEEMLQPAFNTIHSCHSGIDVSGPWFKRRLGDIFWYADSPTFDKLSDFYHWLPIFGTRALGPDLAPEHIFYYYAKMFNISINSKPIYYVTIARDADYANYKKDAGLGPLGEHEILC